MVNFHDPDVIAKESRQVDGLWYLVDGIFIWEFVITLEYEWNVIRGRRPYRWTLWLYSLTRVATLAAVALNIFSISVTTPVNCLIVIDFQFILGYLAFAASSLLIVLRIIAVWNWNKIIVALVTGVWLTTIAFLIQGVSRFRSSWEADWGCVFQLDSIRLSTIATFADDIILILIMLFGLYHLRRRGGGLMGLGRLLWNHGVVWLLLAVTAELLPTVFIILNLNQTLNTMFQLPWVITMSIAATRMYRSLTDFLSSDVPQRMTPTSGRIALENNSISTAPRPLAGSQVVAHKAYEQHWTPQANHLDSSFSGQPREKPQELVMDLVCDHDMKGGAEK